MPKRNCDSADRPVTGTILLSAPVRQCLSPALKWCLAPALTLTLAGCATPPYAIRQAPMPEESAEALQIEREISRIQAEDFERQGARPVGSDDVLGGLHVEAIVTRISRVTERPGLPYRAYLYEDRDPNAASLADGRIYISTGMLQYLAGRGSRADELAFILGHELGHTVAQHLVKRFHTLQQQQMLVSLVAAGASAASGSIGQEAGRFVVDAASLLADVAASGFSQNQELEADQFGIRYVMRAGYDPHAALDLLQDFARFETPSLFLRTHPYVTERRAQLARYLMETTHPVPVTVGGRIESLRRVQQLYPKESVSWRNLQQQIDALQNK